LVVYKSPPAHFVDGVSTNPAQASPPPFARLAQKAGTQPMRLQITSVSKFANYSELLVHQYGRVVTYTLRKTFPHSSCFSFI